MNLNNILDILNTKDISWSVMPNKVLETNIDIVKRFQDELVKHLGHIYENRNSISKSLLMGHKSGVNLVFCKINLNNNYELCVYIEEEDKDELGTFFKEKVGFYTFHGGHTALVYKCLVQYDKLLISVMESFTEKERENQRKTEERVLSKPA